MGSTIQLTQKKNSDRIKILNLLKFWKKTSAIKSCCMR